MGLCINNIYSSLGVPATEIPLYVTTYAKHAFYDTWMQVYRWLISYIMPLSDGTPANICMYFIFLVNKIINRQAYILQPTI